MTLSEKVDTIDDENMGEVCMISSYEVKKAMHRLKEKSFVCDKSFKFDNETIR